MEPGELTNGLHLQAANAPPQNPSIVSNSAEKETKLHDSSQSMTDCREA